MASWVALFGAAAGACGDSATGSQIPDPNEVDGSINKDAGKSDGSVVVPPQDAGRPDTSNPQPDSGFVSDGGLPTVSTTTLDFGETDCGNTATAQTFTISNPSATTVSFTSALVKANASPFTISPATGSIAGGETVTLTVTPKAVPVPSTTSANGLGDTLNLAIGPTNATVDLKQTAHGAVLRFSIPNGIDFGNTPIGGIALESSFAVTNAGNATIPITLGFEPDPSLDGGASPFALTLSPTSATPGFKEAKVSFQPTEERGYNGQIKLTPGTGPLCDVAPANLPVKGTGTNGVISVSPASISFGDAGFVNCGTTATPTRVKVTNTSSSAVTYTASLGKGNSLYTVNIAPGTANNGTVNGTIAAAPSGGSTTVELIVAPKALPLAANFTDDFYADELTIVTNGPTGATDNKVDLHQSARGATLTRSTNSIDFGNVNQGTTGLQEYTFQNVGNVDITVQMANARGPLPDGGAPAGGIVFSQPSPVTIPGGGFVTQTIEFYAPVSAQQTWTDTATIQQVAPAVPLCQTALPANLSLKGVNVAPQTVLSQNTLAFGQVPCGTTPAAKSFRITNKGPAVSYDLTLTGNHAGDFTFSPASPIAIPANGFADVTVTPNQVSSVLGIGARSASLEIKPQDLGRPQVAVALSLTPQGAIINFTNGAPAAGASLSFGTVKNPAVANKNVTVSNTGNIPADLTFVTTSSVADVYTTAPASQTIVPGTPLTAVLTFTPPVVASNTTITGTWAVSTTSTLCAPLPLIVPNPNGSFPLTGVAAP